MLCQFHCYSLSTAAQLCLPEMDARWNWKPMNCMQMFEYKCIIAFFPCCSDGKESACIAGVRSMGQEGPLRREGQPTPVFLPGELHGLRSLAGYSPWDRKESDTTERLTLSLCFAFFRRGVPCLHQLLHGIFDLKKEMKVCPGVALSQVDINICCIALCILSGEYSLLCF